MDNQSLPFSSSNSSFRIQASLSWIPPKYKIGQIVNQGQIVGVQYSVNESQCTYWVSRAEDDDICDFRESEIEPLGAEELQTLIQQEIECYQSHLIMLNAQLKACGAIAL